MSSSLDQAVRSSWGPVTVCPTTSIWFTHASPWRVIAGDREFILCDGAPPRGLSDETTSLGTMAAAMERKPTPALQHPHSGRLLLGECLSAGQQGCGPTGRTARIFLTPIASPTASSPRDGTPSYSTAPRTSSQGMVFLFRWPCYQIQAGLPVNVWSNHACQVVLSQYQHCLLK